MKKRIYKDTMIDDIVEMFNDYFYILKRIGLDKRIKKKLGNIKQKKPHHKIRWLIKREMNK